MLNFKKIARQTLALLGMVGVLAFAAGNASAGEPMPGGRAAMAQRHTQQVNHAQQVRHARHAHRAVVRHVHKVKRHHHRHAHRHGVPVR